METNLPAFYRLTDESSEIDDAELNELTGAVDRATTTSGAQEREEMLRIQGVFGILFQFATRHFARFRGEQNAQSQADSHPPAELEAP